MPDFTAQFAAMIGIGVGIDYALLIVTRFREGRARGLNTEDAIAKVAATSGRLVLVPSVMQVMGRINWWFPPWLDRIVPRISIEADETPSPDKGAFAPAGE